MTFTIGYYAVNDGKYGPNENLDHVVAAEKAGFDMVWTSDHFEPFTHRGMNSPFAWVWLAAAAERTKRIELGTAVTAPILRYSPGLVAQAFATLDVLYPRRISLGLGIGESVNEYPLGFRWPTTRERIDRLNEAVQIINRLWSEDFVDFNGAYHQVRRANLYNKPTHKVPLFIASVGPRVAEIAGRYADGHIHPIGVPRPERLERFRTVIRPAIERGALAVGRQASEVASVGTITSSFARDLDAAARASVARKGSLVPGLFTEEFKDPREIESIASNIPDEVASANTLLTDGEEPYIKAIVELANAGFGHVYISNWGPDPDGFFRLFERKVIPYLRSSDIRADGPRN